MKAVIVRVTQQPMDTVWYFNQVGDEYLCKDKHPYDSWYSVIQQGEVQDRGFVIHQDDCEVVKEVNVCIHQAVKIIE